MWPLRLRPTSAVVGRFVRRCAAPLLLFPALACSGDPDQAARTRFFVGDTLVVDNHAPRHAAAARLERVARYGSGVDAGPAALGRILALAVGADGTVYVYDGGEGIKRFDRDGEFAGWMARPGAGPGEVQHTVALAARGSGELAALDLGNRRVLVVTAAGESHHFRLPDGLPRRHEDALHFGADGVLRVGMNPPFLPDGAEPTPRLSHLGLTPAGVFADSIMVPDRIWERCPTRSEPAYRRGFWEDMREPFVPKAVWALGPDGTWALACPDRYEFDIRRADGSILRVRRAGAEPLRLERPFQRFLAEWGSLPGMPDRRPAFARLIVPGDGRVWVWPNQPGESWTPPAELQASTGVTEAWRISRQGAFDVYTTDGLWLGTVPMPAEVGYTGFPDGSPVVIRGDTLWAVTRDEWDVEYVTRYRVHWE